MRFKIIKGRIDPTLVEENEDGHVIIFDGGIVEDPVNGSLFIAMINEKVFAMSTALTWSFQKEIQEKLDKTADKKDSFKSKRKEKINRKKAKVEFDKEVEDEFVEMVKKTAKSAADSVGKIIDSISSKEE